MEDTTDCLIDLNSPVPNNLKTSFLQPTPACHKSTTAFPNFGIPSLIEDNNPFDLVVRQTEMNEADKNDPFEMAFETACGYEERKTDLPGTSKDSKESTKILKEKPLDVPKEKSAEISSRKSAEVPLRSQALKECNVKSMDGVNLDDIEPPEFLVNSSFDLSDNDSITINDTLHLSSMSDFKLTPGEKKCSPLLSEHYKADNFLSAESPVSSKIKSLLKNAVPKRFLSPIDFPTDPLTTSPNSGSFEDSPIKALCELKSEESIKTLIENRIQKCIAKALNDSHQQFRNSILMDAGETFLGNQEKPAVASLRASLSVPRNLHLLHREETCLEPEQPHEGSKKILEELTIPVLNHTVEATRSPLNRSIDITNNKLDSSSAQTTENRRTSIISDEKMSEYRKIIEAELKQSEHNPAHSSPEVTTESQPKGHRRSLSCDGILPPQLPTKTSSPPKLPPLPLSSETIRDLGLCSKYSPPKSKQRNRSPGNPQAKIMNRLVPTPACAQPKLFLKRKPSTTANGPVTASGSFGGTTNGPMKAIVPVRNMARFTGSPRPSAQTQNRRGSIALSKQTSLDSPSFQKSKLCPLAASTPSYPPFPDKAETIRAPVVPPPQRRTLSSAIPSPSRRGSNAPSAIAKPGTPTRRISTSTCTRNSNPRVLLDKNNSFTSPTVTPIRKPGVQISAHPRLPKSSPQTLGKENMAFP